MFKILQKLLQDFSERALDHLMEISRYRINGNNFCDNIFSSY